MNRCVMPTLLLVREENLNKVRREIESQSPEVKELIHLAAFNSLMATRYQWKLFSKDVKITGLQVAFAPMGLSLDMPDAESVKEFYDIKYQEAKEIGVDMIKDEFEAYGLDYDELPESDKEALIHFYTCMAMCMFPRFSRRTSDINTNYFISDENIVSRVNEMETVISSNGKFDDVFALIDIVEVDDTVIKFIEELLDRYDEADVSFMVNTVFKVTYSHEGMVRYISTLGNAFVGINHMTQVMAYDDEDEILKLMSVYVIGKAYLEQKKDEAENLIAKYGSIPEEDRREIASAVIETIKENNPKLLDEVENIINNMTLIETNEDLVEAFDKMRAEMDPEKFRKFCRDVLTVGNGIVKELINELESSDDDKPKFLN